MPVTDGDGILCMDMSDDRYPHDRVREHDGAGLTTVHDDLPPAPTKEVEPDKLKWDLMTMIQNLKARKETLIDLTPDADARPEDRFLDELRALLRRTRRFHSDGIDHLAEYMRNLIRGLVRAPNLSANEQSELLDSFISFSYRPLIDTSGRYAELPIVKVYAIVCRPL